MRVEFIPPTAAQFGGSFPVYRGLLYQRGEGLGSIFKSVLRFLLPVGKAVGKEALRAGAAIASDAIDGRDLSEAASTQMKRSARRLVKGAATAQKGAGSRGAGRRRRPPPQKGKGLGRPRKQALAPIPIKGRKKRNKRQSAPANRNLSLYYNGAH